MVMTLEETKKVIDKIKIHRLSFGNQLDKSGMENLKLEWFRILEPYDYVDVDEKLNEYFRDGDNEGKYPNPYYLVKYLKTSEKKNQTNEYYVICPQCQEYINLSVFDSHYNKCLSMNYVISSMKKYFNKKITREELSVLSDKVFWDKYYELAKRIEEMLPEGIQKDCLKVITGKISVDLLCEQLKQKGMFQKNNSECSSPKNYGGNYGFN